MTDRTRSTKKLAIKKSHSKPHPKVDAALHLNGSNESLKEFYADWADNYDTDTQGINYRACQITFDLLQRVDADPRASPSLKLVDVGCGTGLMGKLLHQNGYLDITGYDLSQAMIDQAEKLGVYRSLVANFDINHPIAKDRRAHYQCTLSVGVFTPNHVDPQALQPLVEMTVPGGYLD